MRILHLSAVKNWGGGENHIENLCRELKKIAPEVENIILCTKSGLFHNKIKNTGFKVIPAVLDFKMDPRYIAKLISVCKEEKISLIHIHDTTALTLAVMGDHFYDLPPFILSKKTSFPIKPRKQTIFKYNYPKIRRILCVSKATEVITGKRVKDRSKLKCIYHGTAIAGLNSTWEKDLRKELKLPEETIIIGNIANHIRAKHLQTFCEVANELINVRKLKHLHFLQIGTYTNLTVNLKKLVSSYNLDSHISFLGEIPQAAGLIPQFNISLITSQSEGLPQFLYESLYHRVPVVSTDVGGIREIIKHLENGLLSPAHEPVNLAEHVQKLIDDPQLGKKMSRNNREIIEKKFTANLMAVKTYKEYKLVLNGRI